MARNFLLLKLARRYPFQIALTIGLGLSGAIFNGVSTALVVPAVLSILDQNINLGTAPPFLKLLLAPFDSISPDYRLGVMTLAIVVAIALKNLTNYLNALTSTALKEALSIDLREQALQMLLEVDLDYFCKVGVGDVLNRVNNEVGRAAGALKAAIRIGINAITILIFVGLLLAMSWPLTVATSLLLSLVVVLNQYFISRAKEFGRQLSSVSRAYSIRLTEALTGIRLIKEAASERREYHTINQLLRERERLDYRSQANYAAIAPISEVAGVMALIVIVYLGSTFFSGQLREVSAILLTYLVVLFRLLPVLSQLNGSRSQFANYSPSVDILADFLRRDNKPFMADGSVQWQPMQEGIQFDHVSFAYPGSDELALSDITLALPKGKTLALVGASGAGKTTLADLLPRFYDPTGGAIRIDGRNLREFDQKSLRGAMGIVSQEAFLFNDTIRNNVAYARPDASDAEIIDALKRANAYEFVTDMPQGLETPLGDRGVLLSGGQRQRIAIARALLKNAEILILDEATSALDTVSERLVQAAIDDARRDRTTLVIAHRLSTIQNADQIAVMHKGSVVELGSHEELLSKDGYYAHLHEMQFTTTDSTQAHSRNDQILSNASFAIRNHLNGMIGSLAMIVDDLVDTPEEEHELVRGAYDAATSLLTVIEILERKQR
ncbi:MAG: ABC transporter ATP-binding protein [Synechococcales bacterium]|nr:ABC transporter ATP-binding protein [Synechococcales bacterium]